MLETIALLSNPFYVVYLRKKDKSEERYVITGTYYDDVVKACIKEGENNATIVSIYSVGVNHNGEIYHTEKGLEEFWKRAYELKRDKEI